MKMKAIYYFDEKTRRLIGSDVIADDAAVPENATLIEPINDDQTGMYDPTWNGVKWVGITQEQWENEHKDDPQPDTPKPAPTPEQMMINQLGLRVAKLEQQSKEGA
ncbi:MAG TPA: hypothetical protein K8V00_01710 [Ligilactobacillus acidipiscis]|uniref:Uncharacterized protein n=1 Tax=Ligilactobacillus acidipiscis TaxID=89059 RepID=A0A921F8X3_9LACO|nr:hypothetical protein [Ligilactobacillus acidipiscis]